MTFDPRHRRMRVMRLEAPGRALQLAYPEVPKPGPDELLVKVRACGVCRTDLHICDGELPPLAHTIVPGHEIVGIVEAGGERTGRFKPGSRVCVPWLGSTCGHCTYCASGRENLCDEARFTGYQIDGGYADYVLADAAYCFAAPHGYSDVELAPLLCAGLIGYRALRMAGEGHRVGLYGFGAAAHIIAQVAVHEGREIYAFTRSGDNAAQALARDLGASWVGSSDAMPPEPLDAAIIFAPVGALVPAALKAVAKGGTVVCAGIHMSEIPAFAYELLRGERRIVSVANLTRRDGEEFLALAGRVRIRTHVRTFGLEQANEALSCLRQGEIEGAAVLVMN